MIPLLKLCTAGNDELGDMRKSLEFLNEKGGKELLEPGMVR